MCSSRFGADFRHVQELHRRLLSRAAETPAADVAAVLNLGAAVLLHGSLEPTHLGVVWSWVDPAVRVELEREHQALAEDLDFLSELVENDPDSEDLLVTTAALRTRLTEHIERDDRTLYAPLARYAELGDEA